MKYFEDPSENFFRLEKLLGNGSCDNCEVNDCLEQKFNNSKNNLYDENLSFLWENTENTGVLSLDKENYIGKKRTFEEQFFNGHLDDGSKKINSFNQLQASSNQDSEDENESYSSNNNIDNEDNELKDFVPPEENLLDRNKRISSSNKDSSNNKEEITNMSTQAITNNKKAIFKIIKIAPVLTGTINYEEFKIRTKMDEDEILIKIKKHTNAFYLNLLNSALKYSDNEHLNKLQLYKIDTKMYTITDKDVNLKLLEIKVKDIFTLPLSSKYKNFPKDSNRIIIKSILEENDEKINKYFNLSFKDMINMYVHTKINEDLEKFRKNGDSLDYINKYREIALNFESHIRKIIPRSKRKENLLVQEFYDFFFKKKNLDIN